MTRVNDITVGVSDVGSGHPVVFVHGLAEDRHSWTRQLADLTGIRRLAVDLRGHGETSLGAPDGTLAQLVGDLTGFLEATTGPATCVGFSLGGVVVLAAAVERPDLVEHAIVLGTSSVVGSRARSFFVDRIQLAESGDHAALAAALEADTEAQLATDADAHQITKRRLAAIGDGGGYVNAARAMVELADEPLTPRLSEVRCHVDVIGGSEDVFCPRKAADIVVDALPDASYREIDGAGHLMTVDKPEAVTAAIREAITKREQS